MFRSFAAVFTATVLLLGLTLSSAARAESTSQPVAEPAIRIAAASSLQFVLNAVIDEFVKHTGHTPPQVVYGSSGNLFRQIMQGAPYDLFLSADSQLTEKLAKEKKAIGTAEHFGVGKLVVYVNKRSSAPLQNGLAGFNSALNRGVIGDENTAFKMAIANPRHAPYGRAAQQALQSLELWEVALPRLVYAEKVSQAAQFVTSGATELALISLSLAKSQVLIKNGHHISIPQLHYEPVVQAMVQMTNTMAGEALFDFIRHSGDADEIFRDYGLR